MELPLVKSKRQQEKTSTRRSRRTLYFGVLYVLAAFIVIRATPFTLLAGYLLGLPTGSLIVFIASVSFLIGKTVLQRGTVQEQIMSKNPIAMSDLAGHEEQSGPIDFSGVVTEHGNGNRKAIARFEKFKRFCFEKFKRRRTAKTNSNNNNNKDAAVLDCSICLETVESFQGYALSACRHAFCRSCLHGYIQSQISSKQVLPHQLKCPNSSSSMFNNKCTGRLSHADVRACTLELGDTKSWQAFQDVATETFLDAAIAASSSSVSTATAEGEAAAAAASSIRRCPTNHCNFTFQYDTPNVNSQQGQLFICPKCNEAYCLHCPVVREGGGGGRQLLVGPAHDDMCYNVLKQVRQSKERQRKLEEWKRDNAAADDRFQELLQSEGKKGVTLPCPQCHTPITKNGGCDHMRCAKCSHSFNWSAAAMKH
jgi:Zinc finger, C3HC4 type (RING finger)